MMAPMATMNGNNLCFLGAKVLSMRIDGCSIVELIRLDAIFFHVCQHLPHLHHLFALTPSSDERCIGSKDRR